MATHLHPHVAERPRSGWVRVDLHSHTMWSGDATTTPDELAEAIEAAGIDVLCITDHNTIAGAVALRDQLPCRVVVGEELRTGVGEIIGLFLTEPLARGLRLDEAVHRIHGQGGLVYVPHPFDPTRHCLREAELHGLASEGQIDAVEVLNAKTSLRSLNDRARAFADEHDLAHGAGSDAHVPDALGAAYVEMPDFDSPAGFLDSLRRGTVVGHHWDGARPWRPRIVPSTKAL